MTNFDPPRIVGQKEQEIYWDPSPPLGENIAREVENLVLNFTNRVPGWLRGRILRNGPGIFALKGGAVSHGFDGLSVLSSVEFGDTQRFTLKRLKTRQSDQSILEDRFSIEGFDSILSPLKSAMSRARMIAFNNNTDGVGFENANINILSLDGRFAAVGESNRIFEFNPKNLETIGSLNSPFLRRPLLIPAHPARCPVDGFYYNLVADWRYRFVKQSSIDHFQEVGRFSPKKRFYSHSVGITPNFLIGFCGSMELHLAAIMNPFQPISKCIKASPGGNGIFIMDRSKREIQFVPVADLNCFHVVNTFELGGKIYIDTVDYDPKLDVYALGAFHEVSNESSPIRQFTVLESEVKSCVLRRIISADRCELLENMTLFSGQYEFPAIRKGLFGLPYRYAYLTEKVRGQILLTKLDLITKNTLRFSGTNGEYFCEPIFVASPESGSKFEDDGIIVSFSKCPSSMKNYIVLIAAQTMSEISRAEIPLRLPWPLGLHGVWDQG